jgi:hypothetical protein
MTKMSDPVWDVSNGTLVRMQLMCSLLTWFFLPFGFLALLLSVLWMWKLLVLVAFSIFVVLVLADLGNRVRAEAKRRGMQL